MPWSQPGQPALLMGSLHASLASAGFEVSSHSFFLEFADMFRAVTELDSEAFTLSYYQEFVAEPALAELLFSVEKSEWQSIPKPARNTGDDQMSRHADMLIDEISGFVDRCANEIFERSPDVLVLVCHGQEHIQPALRLARVIREGSPSMRIILVGDRVEEPVGATIVSRLDYIDFALGLDPDVTLPSVLSDLLGARIDPLRLYVGDAELALPRPDFDEYYARLRRLPVSGYIAAAQWLPYDMSRGCWWAEVSKCSFCALTGTNETFRRRDPERVIADLEALVDRHQMLRIFFADWIMPHRGVDDLVTLLSRLPQDCRFFMESRPDLRREEFDALSKVGAELQLGIETLNPALLKLMRKGTRVLNNVKALRMSLESGTPVSWNLMAGHPGEMRSDAQAMMALIPSLVHLPPPTLHRFRLHRLSPIFEQPESYGLREIRPMAWHETCFPEFSDEDLMMVADEYEFEWDGYDSSVDTELADLVAWWNQSWPAAGGSLWCESGRSFCHIHDARPGKTASRVTLTGETWQVFQATADGGTAGRIARQVHGADDSTSVERCQKILDSLHARDLLYEESGWYLSLPIRK